VKIELTEDDVQEMAKYWIDANLKDKQLNAVHIKDETVTLHVGAYSEDFVGDDEKKADLGTVERQGQPIVEEWRG
jgi:hypothetical protein